MVDETLTAGAVARRLGVAVTTLRTWHQRYGLGPSRHVPGHHRRYTVEDLERLQVMRRLTAQGVAPAEAASWAKRLPVPFDFAAPSVELSLALSEIPAPAPPRTPDSLDAWQDAHGIAADQQESDLGEINWLEVAQHLSVTARDGGGHTIRTGKAGPTARGLARAAMRLDAPAIRDILEMTVTATGVVAAWEEVLMPVLIGIGERYEATRRYIEVEHLFSRTVTEVLATVGRPPSDRVPRVLLAASDEEQHTLPLEALAAALAEIQIPSRLLGPRVPTASLVDAVARTGPSAVVLWSQTAETGSADQWEILLTSGYAPLLPAAAGPGWPAEGLPDGVTRLNSLPEAVRVLSAVAAHS